MRGKCKSIYKPLLFLSVGWNLYFLSIKNTLNNIAADFSDNQISEHITIPNQGEHTIQTWPRTAPLLTWNDLQNKTLPKGCDAYFNETRLNRKKEILNYDGTTGSLHHQLCLVTHFTPSRMHMFQAMLQRWPGCVSAALYIEPSEVERIKEQPLKITNRRQDQTRITLVYAQGKYYPVNQLRNIALRNAKAEYVFMVDGDFVPSSNLYETLLDIAVKQEKKKPYEKVLWVVPAFEQYNRSDAPLDKTDLLTRWNNKIVKPAHLGPKTRNAQGPTDFTKWQNSTIYYKAKYKEGFEPYVMLQKNQAPLFIELFLERYGDKVSYFVEMNARGFEFIVLPDVFVVHLPHKKRETPYLYRDIGSCTRFIFNEMKKRAKELEEKVS